MIVKLLMRVAMVAALGLLTLLVAENDATAVGEEGRRSSNLLSENAEAEQAGQPIYRAKCAYCHGMKADGRGRGLPNAANLRKFKRGYTRFVKAVKEGYKTMPPWGGMGELTDEEINQVGAYLETLAKRNANWADPEELSDADGVSVDQVATNTVEPAAPKEYQIHIGHILDAWQDTPGQLGLATILEQEAAIASEHAAYAVADLEDWDVIRTHTAHVRHAIDPAREANGPGKGYGVVAAAEAIVQHMTFARDTADANESVKLHAKHVLASVANIHFWCSKILDKAAQISGGASPISSAFFAEEIVEHLTWIQHGRDADADGTISWGLGEGGLAQIRAHLSYIE
ncbi:MAG: hypothetical protein CMM23_20910 [Rhodospirillaceae bacterium]|jgi:mono/diheme cytochrome c family protein|nr:hypothetical protein [Rhodospirillaceae bacterium]MDP7488013.1 cytochrome c [Alphaproteobacteria bacterium]|tara:strand:+ start:637 stop:1668 length:1032 start_codon:yes stop_codon:yes gene_type:complete